MTEKHQHMSGPTQCKPMSLKGQASFLTPAHLCPAAHSPRVGHDGLGPAPLTSQVHLRLHISSFLRLRYSALALAVARLALSHCSDLREVFPVCPSKGPPSLPDTLCPIILLSSQQKWWCKIVLFVYSFSGSLSRTRSPGGRSLYFLVCTCTPRDLNRAWNVGGTP